MLRIAISELGMVSPELRMSKNQSDEGICNVRDRSAVRLDFNSTNTSPCRDMTYVVFPDRRKSLATKNLRRLVPRIGRNSLLGNRLR